MFVKPLRVRDRTLVLWADVTVGKEWWGRLEGQVPEFLEFESYVFESVLWAVE